MVVVLRGFDLVLFVDGCEEEGKVEIEVEYDGYVYCFFSEFLCV